MANALMAAGYGLVLLTIYRHPLRPRLWFFLLYCIIGVPYSLFLTTVGYWVALTTSVTVLRLIPPVEAVWRFFHDRNKPILSIHLALQLTWTILQLVLALSYPWMKIGSIEQQWRRWMIGRWVYTIVFLCIVAAYSHYFTKSEESEAAELDLRLAWGRSIPKP
jgi:hypothetical protein